MGGGEARHGVNVAAQALRYAPAVRDVTTDDIDALIGPTTPHFAYQIRARVRQMVEQLAEDDPVRRYGEEKMELLERLGHASSKAEEGGREAKSRIGWDEMPSSAPAWDPLPPRDE